jgi:membrane-bound ClpP family serine protease
VATYTSTSSQSANLTEESTMCNKNLTMNFHENTEFIFRIEFVVVVAIICVRFLAVVVVCVFDAHRNRKREKSVEANLGIVGFVVEDLS